MTRIQLRCGGPQDCASLILAVFTDKPLIDQSQMALPNNLIWLILFYMYFHSFTNLCAELLRFGDRQFYRDWWNAHTVSYFWRNWNIPVHKWMLRHVYRPLRAMGCSRTAAVTAVFALSVRPTPRPPLSSLRPGWRHGCV